MSINVEERVMFEIIETTEDGSRKSRGISDTKEGAFAMAEFFAEHRTNSPLSDGDKP